MIGDKAVRTNSRYEAQLPVTTPHTRMPQTAYYAHQAQTTPPPPGPHQNNFFTLRSSFKHSHTRACKKDTLKVLASPVTVNYEGKIKRNAKLSLHYQLKGLSMFSAGFYPPANQETFLSTFCGTSTKNTTHKLSPVLTVSTSTCFMVKKN